LKSDKDEELLATKRGGKTLLQRSEGRMLRKKRKTFPSKGEDREKRG